MDTIVGSIVDGMMARLSPKMTELVSNASSAAEPVVRRVVVEEVLPKFGLAAILGLAAGAAAAGAIGAYFATRRR